MKFGMVVGLAIAVGIISSLVTYLITRLRMERASAERGQALADAVAALDNERAKFEQAAKGIVIAFPDLLIGVTALYFGYAVATLNPRHFQLIPGLAVIHL